MLTIKPTPDYDAILRWNAGKDEAFLGRHSRLPLPLDEGAAHASVCQGRRYGFHGI